MDTAWEDGGTLLVKAEGMNADGIPAYNLFRVDLADGTVERVLQPDNTSGGEVQPWVFVDCSTPRQPCVLRASTRA